MGMERERIDCIVRKEAGWGRTALEAILGKEFSTKILKDYIMKILL